MGQLCGIRASSNVEIHSRNTELQLKLISLEELRALVLLEINFMPRIGTKREVAVVCHGRSCGSFLSSVRSSVDCVPRRAFSDGSLS
ncbi:hypothetical protein U9M48_020093 [Paspalum notatum var. saurae]|uniref:Uncharacterized protein n=1 Tax=Paspalum notatum var. saurae TaxID=547442 RepID=A0AAQ3TGV4_PASNO